MQGESGKPAYYYAGIVVMAGFVIALIWIYLINITNSISGVQNGWVAHQKEASQRTILLSELHSLIGYGGYIHNFKNYVLRGSNEYKNKVENDQKNILAAISSFQKLPLLEKEIAAINQIEMTFREYFKKFDDAKLAVANGRYPREIDALVKVNDGAALRALSLLTQGVIEKAEFHRKATDSAIQDTVKTIGLGIVFIPLVFLSSLLFIFILRRANLAQLEANYAKEQFKAVLEAVPDVIIVSDQDGKITQANNQIEQLIGYNRDEILTMTIEDLLPDRQKNEHHIIRKNFFSGIGRRSMGGVPYLSARRKGGDEVPVDIALGSFDNNGTQYVVASMRDMTKKREIDLLLHEAKEKAEALSSAKSDFLANMSHELRTPLNAILGFSEALLTNNFGEIGNKKHEEYISHVYKSGTHLLKIINDILDISKVDAGKLELYEEEVSVADIILSCLDMMVPHARTSGLQLNYNIDIKGIVLWGDGTRLKQMLLNLLSNAIKFSEINSAIIIDAFIQDDGSCVLSVADQGIGMNKQAIEIALETFGQVESHLTRTHEGTGLGVPLTKLLTELHGGSFELESQEGKGTTARIILPAERVLKIEPAIA
ncbi:MAG: PAS domain S-box protein [Rhodospirillales bacterium]|nr:PAS domain S-box protein [Rhodospirillales bacterium]